MPCTPSSSRLPQPRELTLLQAVRGLDLGSAAIRWQQKQEELDDDDQPIRITSRRRT